MKITLAHARSIPCSTKYGYCSSGLRKWANLHNINWQEFILNGIDEEILLKTNDAMAIKLVKWVKENGC